MGCYFYNVRTGCQCLTVDVCPAIQGKSCSFYKTREEYFEGLERVDRILASKGLKAHGNTVLPIVEAKGHTEGSR